MIVEPIVGKIDNFIVRRAVRPFLKSDEGSSDFKAVSVFLKSEGVKGYTGKGSFYPKTWLEWAVKLYHNEVFILYDDDEIKGILWFTKRKKMFINIHNILVSVEMRGKGIGTKFISILEDFARKNGDTYMICKTPTGSRASKFWEKVGFNLVESRIEKSRYMFYDDNVKHKIINAATYRKEIDVA